LNRRTNKKKILNDPVYGFISIPSDLIYDIIEHPYFQRLRRIKQLGLTDFVYPGALHTRFHHAIGAMHLMSITLDNLRSKRIPISEEEYEASLLAILLHDVGHGPFSHALENTILQKIPHEELSILVMERLNEEMKGGLSLTLEIFRNQYHRRFFHQLVSSQLDIDRLDYLSRDSFFTGVSEGTIGADRIIKMLTVKDDQLLVEEKGIYSIENFLSARRLMYWQVYLHKATVSAEKMFISVIRRAKHLEQTGVNLFASPNLKVFLQKNVTLEGFKKDRNLLDAFGQLDDYDLWGALKIWSHHEDFVLSQLSKRLLERKLFRVVLSNTPPPEEEIQARRDRLQLRMALKPEEMEYFLVHGSMSNAAYVAEGQTINILTKKQRVIDVAEAADLPNIRAMSKIVTKYYLCYPKELEK